jgi:biotin carboxylase
MFGSINAYGICEGIYMKKILIIGAGILQVPAIIEAKKMGYKVATFDQDKNAPGFILADESYQISTLDIIEATTKAIEIKPDGVMTLASDMPLRTVASIAQTLGLKAISIKTAEVATNKLKMRDELERKKVPIPCFYKVDEFEEFKKVVRNFKTEKIIVKPADNSGSRGVQLCDTTNLNIKETYDYSKKFSRSGELIVEEYMNGPEVSVETFSLNGKVHVIAITDKVTTGTPYFVEMGHSQPSKLDIELQKEVCNVATAAVLALEVFDGPSHVEIIVTEQGPKIVELGARLGGDNISTSLVPLSTGVNLVKACIQLALGEIPDIKNKFNRAAIIKYIDPPKGEIISIHGIEEIRESRGVEEFVMLKHVGQTITEIRNSTERSGFLISSGDDLKDVTNQINIALDKLDIITK